MADDPAAETPDGSTTEPTLPVRPRRGGALGPILVVACLVLVAVLVGITGLGRTVRSAPIVLTALVTVLPYLFGGVLVLLFAAWSLAPDRRLLPGLLAIVLVLGAVIWGPAMASRGQTADGTAVRVVSWNVRRLWGGPDTSRPADQCVVDTLRALDADVLSLQEVSRRDVDTLTAVLDLTCSHTDYLGRDDPDDGGLAVCVRAGDWSLERTETPQFVRGQPWNYVFTEVSDGTHVFNVLGVHLQPYRLGSRGLAGASEVPSRQGDQSAELLRRVRRFKDPTVVAGDFNSTRDGALHVSLRDELIDAFERGGSGLGATFHFMDWLPVRIDYVYVTPSFAVVESRIVPEDCSDHRAVVSELVLRE